MDYRAHYADEGPLYFYGGPFSNFAASPFEREPLVIGGLDYGTGIQPFQTVEHWFAAHKTQGTIGFLQIALARGPSAAKQFGRDCKLRADWEEIKYEVMVAGLREKFKIASYRSVLLETGAQPIAEDSPTDTEWGITRYDWGSDVPTFTGKNLLGLGLMQVRAEIKGISEADAKLKALQIQRETWPEHNPHDIGVPAVAHR